MRPKRILAVGVGVALAGAGMGAVAGMAVTTSVVIAVGLRADGPWLLGEPLVYQMGALFGAVCGVVLAPVAAFGFLRHVPLWRVFLDGALGTILLGVVASLAGASLPGILAAGALGFLGAGLRLARSTPRTSGHPDRSPAA